MRSLPKLVLRAAALALALTGAALLAAPGCSIISAETDCKSACDNLNACNLIQQGDCSLYCAGLATGATIAGCADKFDDQSTCGKENADCTAAASKCTEKVKAFADCMAAYCKDHPDGQGCPGSDNDGG